MSQLDIATLTVLLQANAAQFETQMAQARAAATREARNISREIKQQSYDSRAELMLLGDMFGVHLPREIRKMLSESKLLRDVLGSALGITAAVFLIEKLDLIVDKIKSGAQELGGFTKAMQEFDKANVEASRHAQTHPDNITQGFKNLNDINAQLTRVQSEAAKARAELVSLQTGGQFSGTLLNGGLGVAVKDLVDQFMHVRDLDNDSVRLEKQRLDLIEAMTKMTAQHAANMDQLNHTLATAGLQGVQKSAADIAYLGEQLKKAQDEGNRFKVDEIGKQIQIATKEMNGESLRSGVERLKELNNVLKGLHDIGANALIASDADPFAKIFDEQAKRLQEIESKRTSDLKASSDERKMIELAASLAIIEVNAAAARQIAKEYKDAEDSVGKVTAELSKLSAFPKLAFPDFSQLASSGHGVLDVTGERIREITRDTKTLEQATIGYLRQAQNESQKYAVDVAAVNAAYHAGLLSLTQLNDLTKKLNPNFQKMEQLGRQAAQSITNSFVNSIVMGNKLRDTLASILEELAKIILEAALNPLEKSLGKMFGGLFGNLFGGISVPGKAGGGSVSAGSPYIVGEHGPELMVPGASGQIIPNGGMGGSTIVYQIDARGADAGVEQRVMRAIDASRKQAVRESVVTVREQSLRST